MKIYAYDEETEETDLIDYACDGCMKTAKRFARNDQLHRNGKEWEGDNGQYGITIIGFLEGQHCNEYDQGQAYEFHLCPSCFKKKIFALFEPEVIEAAREEFNH